MTSTLCFHHFWQISVEAGCPVSGIQVCWELNGKNREHLGTKDNYILTYDQAASIDSGFPLIPVWQWLLGWAKP